MWLSFVWENTNLQSRMFRSSEGSGSFSWSWSPACASCLASMWSEHKGRWNHLRPWRLGHGPIIRIYQLKAFNRQKAASLLVIRRWENIIKPLKNIPVFPKRHTGFGLRVWLRYYVTHLPTPYNYVTSEGSHQWEDCVPEWSSVWESVLDIRTQCWSWDLRTSR